MTSELRVADRMATRDDTMSMSARFVTESGRPGVHRLGQGFRHKGSSSGYEISEPPDSWL